MQIQNLFTRKKILLGLFALITAHIVISYYIVSSLEKEYTERQSIIYRDRHNEIITILPNDRDTYSQYVNTVPDTFKSLFLKKEDRFFYWHSGINPISSLRGLKNALFTNNSSASSTIHQQLAKVLLSHEQERTLSNKYQELYTALALETIKSKEDILTMYANSVFLGNQTQGIYTASKLYFNKEPDQLNDIEALQIVSSLSNPSHKNPFTQENYTNTAFYSKKFSLSGGLPKNISLYDIILKKESFRQYVSPEVFFEYQSLPLPKTSSTLTIDKALSQSIREQVQENIYELLPKNALNAAAIVIKLPENEVLAMIGSPNPKLDEFGYRINMALKPRHIGSTIKPFIYLKGFEKGLRPYTTVNDKEYKYIIESGWALYPKNYDYRYRGKVTLHEALANSLNAPTVKVFEYINPDVFNEFLMHTLKFDPIQPLESYQLGIPLGELEMDLLQLTHYFSIFPKDGYLEPLHLVADNESYLATLHPSLSHREQIADPAYSELVNAILSDRKAGVNQFGSKGNLHLPFSGYGVKTGTSQEFRDSLAVGYTKDYLVGVWVGNHDYTPMDHVSGESGAGKIWRDIMTALHYSDYNHNTPFETEHLTSFSIDGNIALGLKNDVPDKYLHLLETPSIIEEPHNKDVFLFENNIQIPLRSNENVTWYVNNKKYTQGQEAYFSPSKPGQYEIYALTKNNEKETLTISIKDDN